MGGTLGVPFSSGAGGGAGLGILGGSGGSSVGGVAPAAAGGGTAIASNPDALTVGFPACSEPIEAVAWRATVLRLVNQQRAANGLQPVTRSATLEAQATQYACELIHYDFFDHENRFTGTTLGDRAAEFGYEYWIIGENLAAGQQTPAQAVGDWMASPCHRENVLNPAFIELGVGVRIGGTYGVYWVQEFGLPLEAERYTGPIYEDPGCDD